MVLGSGTTQSLLQRIRVEVVDEGLEALLKKMRALRQSSQQAAQGTNRMANASDNAASSANNASGQFGQMFSIGMNLMFMGMAMQQVFGRLAGSMLKMTGVTSTFGAAAQSTLLPFFTAISPILNQIAFFFMKLPRPIKMVMGAMVGLLAVMGTLMFFGAQLALLGITLSISFGVLLSSVAALAGVVLVIVSAFTAAYYIFKKFGKIAGGVAALGAAYLTYQILSLVGAIASATSITTAFVWLPKVLAAHFFSLGTAVAWLKSSLFFLGKAFVSFAAKIVAMVIPVLSTIASLFASFLAAIAPILVVVGAIAAGFLAVNKIFKKFGNIMGTVATIVVAAIAVLLAPIVGLPVAIGLAVGAVIAWFWNMRDEIAAALKAVWNWLKKIPGWFGNLLGKAGSTLSRWTDSAVQLFKGLWNDAAKWLTKLLDWILNLPKKITSGLSSIGNAMVELGKSMVNGVINGLKSIGDQIAEAFWNLLPAPLSTALKGISNFTGGLINRITDVFTPNDFILTSGGKMIQPHQDDTIIGTKNPEALGGGGGGNVTVNINDPVMKEDVDVERVVDEVEDRVNRDTRGRTGGLGN